ncbi:hypothetical protein QTP86_027392 [Hemibagrus guttatus]|nr:hypothetical protein QTP86_027392 [Hemibagrus guttatus]
MQERDEQTGQQRRVEKRDEESGQERNVEERDEQLEQRREMEERDEQKGQIREEREQTGQGGKVEMVNELAGKEGEVEERDGQLKQRREAEETDEESGKEGEVELRLCTTLCGLLASCLCSWGSGSFSVSQSPSTVILDEVDQVQIICSWNISIVHGAKVKWFKNNQKLELNQSDRFTETCKNNTCTTLVIKNADRNDEGLYICCVTQDIPFLLTVNGTGTNVTYKGNTDDGKVTSTTQTNSATTSQSQFGSLEAVVGAMASAAGVILSICVCVWWIKTRNRQSERAVIREGPPSEGDEPEHSEDGGSSRTSRGSTQWYMVPVYESYFDLQRSDDQQCAGSDTDAACAEAQK